MNVWQITVAVLGVLMAASWGTVIPVCIVFWGDLKKTLADYRAAVADGTITDAEKVQIADDAMQAIADASNIFQFVINLVNAIMLIIKAAKLNKLLITLRQRFSSVPQGTAGSSPPSTTADTFSIQPK